MGELYNTHRVLLIILQNFNDFGRRGFGTFVGGSCCCCRGRGIRFALLTRVPALAFYQQTVAAVRTKLDPIPIDGRLTLEFLEQTAGEPTEFEVLQRHKVFTGGAAPPTATDMSVGLNKVAQVKALVNREQTQRVRLFYRRA